MFPFRKPPTKLELAKKGVSDAAHHLIEAIPVEQIEEKFDGLKKGALQAASAASVAAHHAGEIAAHQLGALQNAASQLGEGVSSAGQSAAATAAAKASAATQSARETAQSTRETLGETAKTAASFKDHLLHRAADDFKIGSKEAQHAKAVAQKAAEREANAIKARAAAVEAKKQAKKLEKEADNAQKEADSSASQAQQAAADAIAQAKAAREESEAQAQEQAALSAKELKTQAKAEAKARAKAADDEREAKSARGGEEIEFAEVQIAEGGSKWGWIVIGLALGAVLVLLFAPTTGRRSRAAIKDRLGRVGDGAVDAATATSDKIVDIAQRVEGLTHKVEAKLAADGETDDDATVADRVRSILGHHELAKGIERLNIDCADGVVTLRGPMLDEAAQEALITAVKTVPGVKDVIADFLIDEAPENPAESVG